MKLKGAIDFSLEKYGGQFTELLRGSAGSEEALEEALGQASKIARWYKNES